VLVFHGQDITDEQQMAFALNFGKRENPRGGKVEETTGELFKEVSRAGYKS
jgi:hypothetical protein